MIVPGHQYDNRKRPTTELAAMMSWKDLMVVAGTMKMLTAGNIGSKCAAVYQVLGRPALKTPVDGHSKLILELDTCKNIQPVQLRLQSNFLVPMMIRTAALEPVSGGYW